MSLMKFFPRDWPDGSSGASHEAAYAAYMDRIREVASELPADLLALANGYSLHDGLIQGACLDRKQLHLTIQLICGDLVRGYSRAELQYTGLTLPGCAFEDLHRVVSCDDTEILWNEVDLVQHGLYEHRFLCWPDGEFAVQFSAFALKVTPREGREFTPWKPRFRVKG